MIKIDDRNTLRLGVRNEAVRDKMTQSARMVWGATKSPTPESYYNSPATKSPTTKSPITKSPITKSPITKSPITKSPTTKRLAKN